MKLEKLTSTKFKPFEENVVNDLTSIRGGLEQVKSRANLGGASYYDCANPTGTPGTSSGDWGQATWHPGTQAYGVHEKGVCGDNIAAPITILDPKTLKSLVTNSGAPKTFSNQSVVIGTIRRF